MGGGRKAGRWRARPGREYKPPPAGLSTGLRGECGTLKAPGCSTAGADSDIIGGGKEQEARRSPGPQRPVRKVRTPQGTAVGKSHREQSPGQCHRKHTVRLAADKGEKVGPASKRAQCKSPPPRRRRRGQGKPRREQGQVGENEAARLATTPGLAARDRRQRRPRRMIAGPPLPGGLTKFGLPPPVLCLPQQLTPPHCTITSSTESCPCSILPLTGAAYPVMVFPQRFFILIFILIFIAFPDAASGPGVLQTCDKD